MNAKDLERLLASQTPFGATAIDHTARTLRAGNKMPVGGRGFSAPFITPEHAANLLIGLGAARKPTDASHVLDTYSQLEPEEGRGFAGSKNPIVALTTLLGNPDTASVVREVRVCRSWPMVTFVSRRDDMEPTPGAKTAIATFRYGIPGDRKVQLETYFSGDFLYHLAMKLTGSIIQSS